MLLLRISLKPSSYGKVDEAIVYRLQPLKKKFKKSHCAAVRDNRILALLTRLPDVSRLLLTVDLHCSVNGAVAVQISPCL